MLRNHMRMRVWAARGVPAAEGRCAGCSTCRDAHDLRETQTVGLGAIQSLARPRDCFMCGETSNGRWCGATSWCLEVYQKFIIRRSKSDVQNQKWRLPTANAGSTRRRRVVGMSQSVVEPAMSLLAGVAGPAWAKRANHGWRSQYVYHVFRVSWL